MDSEILYVNENPCPHWIVPIPSDGSCLFHSLSFSMYGNIESSYEIRLAIIEYVVAHWDKLQLYTCDERGNPYINTDLYMTAMVKTTTYGSTSELMVAAALYPYAFEVYENGILRGSLSGDSGNPVKRLRFSGNFLGGHYEVLLPEVPPNVVRIKIIKTYLKRVEDLKRLIKEDLKLRHYPVLNKSKNSGSLSPEQTRNTLECFLGKSEHRSNQEPYYAEEAYNLFKNKDKAIEIDDTGKAVFGNVKKHGHSLVWSCNDLCALDENVIIQLTNIFESLVNKSAAQYYTLIEKEKMLECLNYIKLLKAHFLRLRTISREIYQVQSIFNILKDIDELLEKCDVERIKEHGKQQKAGSIIVESEESQEIVEDNVIDKHKAAFKSLKLKCLDTPKLECMSCIKLCYSRDISSLKRLRKAIDTSIWNNLLNYYKTKYLDHSPYICHTCLQKIRANQLPAACVLNDLQVSTVPPQIAELNDYEKILIQRAKAFQVVMLMNPVANKHLPNRNMVKKVKGRTFHLPLPLEETLKKLPRPEHLITNTEMYIMVRGMPTKSKIVWEDIVDVNKVYQALQYFTKLVYQALRRAQYPSYSRPIRI
ncbi:unnamed protein product [Parnassius apollo]|uniref:(apollo) hypothetical protein n=1 Tax=Parnassius apollo TaxID=110799 RepID=A0A8S3WR03_PARAO|nr:unnamed protein product [Parnassius apollo]